MALAVSDAIKLLIAGAIFLPALGVSHKSKLLFESVIALPVALEVSDTLKLLVAGATVKSAAPTISDPVKLLNWLCDPANGSDHLIPRKRAHWWCHLPCVYWLFCSQLALPAQFRTAFGGKRLSR